ncbi:Bifunctional protein HldE [bacterium HR10]|uniref:RfaE bifunctional protein, domain I n=1 Tax=uncultured Acidobacteriota bacterium TaxID=171953 RepID=H5SIS9_9BACT|nr:RfaE bifunctional protein, domain I [uncultured Acidobacteriota bacterium]GBC82247.1 Bifunctional protein HldE [bacterium HR10]
MLHQLERLTPEQAERVLERFAGRRLLVLGDLMLDEYLWGKARRISPEAPVPVVEIERESFRLGGAGNVASNLLALGARAWLVAVTGADAAAERLRALLAEWRIEADGLLTDMTRPTTVKTRILAQHQQVVRADRESRAPLSEDLTRRLLALVRERLDAVEGVVISDYEKGTITPPLLEALLPELRRRHLPVFLDPKMRNFPYYRPVTWIKPNQREAEAVIHREIADEATLLEAGRQLQRAADSDYVLLTRGEHGMTLFAREGWVRHIPTVAREVYDVTGAGDTVMAALSLSVLAGADPLQAAQLANYAASIVIAKLGTAVVTREEIQNALRADWLLRRSDAR